MTNRTRDLVLEGLAVYRATRLLQRDDVPPLPWIREQLMARYGASPWGALLDCSWCLSIWVGLVSVVTRHAAPRIWRIGAGVLASSAVTGLISEYLASLEPITETRVRDFSGTVTEAGEVLAKIDPDASSSRT